MNVRLFDPAELDRGEWHQLQSIQREGFKATLEHRSQEDRDALIDWGDPERYFQSHLDPNTEVGRHFNENQEYTHPRVAVALEGGEPIGFGYTALNASGETPEARRRKQLTVVKNYLWLREIAVEPSSQRKGVGREVGRRLMRDRFPFRRVTAYIWPDEIPFLGEVLDRVGFVPTGEQNVELFPGKPPVRQVRMQAASALKVRRWNYLEF